MGASGGMVYTTDLKSVPAWRGEGSTPSSPTKGKNIAGWSSLVARKAHNLEVGRSNRPPAINT